MNAPRDPLDLDLETLRWLLTAAPEGPRIEFGVCNGGTLKIIADHPAMTFGIDSFEGMAESGPRDRLPDGSDPYPKGRLKADLFATDPIRKQYPGTVVLKGWVPDIFSQWPIGAAMMAASWGFAHIDLDHYEPTMATIAWLWDRMLPGGIICCDDWFEGRDYLAAAAINEWADQFPLANTRGRKAWWIR